MPAISKIRFTNIIYEGGNKRYNDDIFHFDGHNGAILLENGGGKTVFLQTAIQAVLPHSDLGERKIKETLSLEGNAAHIAIEWIINERPRRYLVTAVTLFINNGKLSSYKYSYEYEGNDNHSIEKIPFTKETKDGKSRPSSKEEVYEYYQYMKQQYINAHVFDTINTYHELLEKNYKIIPSEWKNIALINSAEGGVEKFFDGCKTTGQLVDNLLIPTVEEALAGQGTKDFAETFEKQRERFKKHKQLREKIEESKIIEKEIDNYVLTFSNYYEALKEFLLKKEEVKALYNYSSKERENVENRKNEILLVKNEVEFKIQELNRKKASFFLALLKEQLIELKEKYKKIKEDYYHIKEIHEEKEKRQLNLEVASLKKEIKANEDKIKLYRQQLEELDKDNHIIDIKERLEINSSELKGIYEEQESSLEKQKNYIEGQLDRYKEELKINEKELIKLEDVRHELNNNSVSLNTSIKDTLERMDKICRQVLDNYKYEDIEEEYVKWKKRTEELSNAIISTTKEINELQNEKNIKSRELPTLRKELEGLVKRESETKSIYNSIQESQQEILLKLREFTTNWQKYDSLYLKENSIISFFEGRIEKLRLEKEGLLNEERVVHKFYADYKDNSYFTADPSLQNIIESWKNQFNLLESGTEFFQKLSDFLQIPKAKLYNSYPYWSITVVTSEGEVDKLIKKLESKKDSITHPVFIITDNEGKIIAEKNEVIQERYIYPVTWEKNLDENNFNKWKKAFELKANETVKNRKDKENEIERYNSFLQNLKEFYDKYPYEYYKELQDTLRELKEAISSINTEINNREVRISQIDRQLLEYQKKVEEFKGEEILLSSKIQKYFEYIDERSKKERAEEDKYKVEEETKAINIDIDKHKIQIKHLKIKIEDTNEDLRGIKDSIKDIEKDVLYHEVKNYEVKYTNKSKEALEEERKYLKNILNERQSGRREIENFLKNNEETKIRLERDLLKIYKKAQYEIDEEFEFTINGEDEIDRLLDEIKEIEPKLNKLKMEYENKKMEYESKRTEFKLRESDFYSQYAQIYEFRKNLSSVEKELEKEENDLQKELNFIEFQIEKFAKELKEINELINELNGYNLKYSFLIEDVAAKSLPSEIIQDYPYKRKEIVKGFIAELEKLNSKVERYNTIVNDHKNSFILFCEDKIQDTKLKEMAVKGVKNKIEYNEIIDWQLKLKDRISRTIKIAEDDMRQHDEELQHFINHLHTYLYSLAEELRMIPKKTKVKVDGKWKEIYIFDVPSWDEQEGKEKLRQYIDLMISELDSDIFKNENGQEDYTLIKKTIEKRLQSKQLLSNIMKNNEIKVKCRKVTNDGKVNSAPHSWESSNKWSGGEKWSKNMALFLGILNYLAEKRQHISVSQKRSRTVIMDNPFGMASSDHVLDPVFFIAEQLGFQIIALTAHAEGKFIRNYFPVVYSCKLRPSVNNDSFIVTKEKEIRYTFFKDNDPQALQRLGEQEQLTLFETAITT